MNLGGSKMSGPGFYHRIFEDAVRIKAEKTAEAARLGHNTPAVPLPAWAGQQQGAPASQAPSQPASQAPRQPYAPPQLALGAPIGAVTPMGQGGSGVHNQALVDALRAPAAPQASGGNNG